MIKRIELVQNNKYERWRHLQQLKKGINKTIAYVMGILIITLLSGIIFVNSSYINKNLSSNSVNVNDFCNWDDNDSVCTLNCKSVESHLYAMEVSNKYSERPKCITLSFKLILNSPIFKNQRMTSAWFLSNTTINKLDIDLYNIKDIEENAFISNPFRNLIYLKLINLNIFIIVDGMFNGLNNLKTLIIISQSLPYIEPYALTPLRYSLHTLGISQSLKINKILPEELTSGMALMTVKVINYNNNYFPDTITNNSFIHLISVEVLNLSNSSIEIIGAAAFDSIINTIKLIDLSFNKLQTIPPKLFNNILPNNNNLQLHMDNNLWICNCSLQIFQHFKNNFMGSIKCNAPSELKDELLEHIELCNFESSETSTPSISQTSMPTTVRPDDTTTPTTLLLPRPPTNTTIL